MPNAAAVIYPIYSLHGYIEWFEPYQGSSTKLPDHYKDLGLGASVVLTFSDVLLVNKGQLPFHWFFDNMNYARKQNYFLPPQ